MNFTGIQKENFIPRTFMKIIKRVLNWKLASSTEYHDKHFVYIFLQFHSHTYFEISLSEHIKLHVPLVNIIKSFVSCMLFTYNVMLALVA